MAIYDASKFKMATRVPTRWARDSSGSFFYTSAVEICKIPLDPQLFTQAAALRALFLPPKASLRPMFLIITCTVTL